jgi:hypothetical protein
MNHAGHTITQSVGKISWFVVLPKVKASLGLTVGLPVGLGLKPLLWTRIGLKIYGRHLSQERDGELEGVSRDLGDAAGVREGLRGWVSGMRGRYGPSVRTARVGGWDGNGFLGAVPLTVCRSDLKENVLCFHHKNQFGPHRKVLVYPTKTSSDRADNVSFHHKDQFGPHRERLVVPPQSQFGPHRERLV